MTSTCFVDPSKPGGRNNADPVETRQYTLKGVEAEAIDLMRSAASRDGMKIGAWVSLRLKQAAQDSLQLSQEVKIKSRRNVLRERLSPSNETEVLVSALLERIERLEIELADQSRAQRAILTKLLSRDLSINS